MTIRWRVVVVGGFVYRRRGRMRAAKERRGCKAQKKGRIYFRHSVRKRLRRRFNDSDQTVVRGDWRSLYNGDDNNIAEDIAAVVVVVVIDETSLASLVCRWFTSVTDGRGECESLPVCVCVYIYRYVIIYYIRWRTVWLLPRDRRWIMKTRREGCSRRRASAPPDDPATRTRSTVSPSPFSRRQQPFPLQRIRAHVISLRRIIIFYSLANWKRDDNIYYMHAPVCCLPRFAVTSHRGRITYTWLLAHSVVVFFSSTVLTEETFTCRRLTI